MLFAIDETCIQGTWWGTWCLTPTYLDEKQKVQAVRIIKKLISSKSKGRSDDEVAETRIDYISDHLGIVKEEVIQIVYLLRDEKILADSKDLNAFIKKKDSIKNSLSILKSYGQIEKFLLTQISDEEKIIHLKELNEQAEESGCKDVSPNKIKTILNLWAIKNWIKRQTTPHSNNHIAVLALFNQETLTAKLEKRNEIAQFILEALYDLSKTEPDTDESNQEEVPVAFSVLELKERYSNRSTLFQTDATTDEIEDALFHLSRIEALKIEGGFMVVYNALTIERLEKDNKKRYKVEDYQSLEQYYQNKVQQIHIVGEYARKMIRNYQEALQFVDDYFKLNYTAFLQRYFPGSRQDEIKKNITPSKFKQLFGELSPTQLKIINDKESKTIVVAAGPGSGKTRILVHKLASLLLMEDVKYEQLLMVTFSRSAATEFKKRLLKLIGNAASFIEIKTFHSYCFDLLGRVGSLEKSADIILETIKRIKNGDVDPSRITKTVLVIDEAQDMDVNEFELVKALMEHNDGIRVIAVGDDDQNIFEFRGASSKYMENLIAEQDAVMVELVENYRSKRNLVEFANQYLTRIPNRLKNTPIMAVQSDNGKIKRIHYRSRHLITPLVQDILEEGLSGSTCVLTKRNEEAFQIAGLLMKNGRQAKLIQSNEGFSLYNLLEIRFFLSRLNLAEDVYIICDDIWKNAKLKLAERFGRSLNLESCINLIKDFEAANPKYKYKTDLEVFIRESKLEDFIGENTETIFVSTIHKAKGREFDNVFLMLDQFEPGTNEAVRQLYVAMTRAKHNLTIYENGNYLDSIKVDDMQVVVDSQTYLPPQELVMQLSHRDVQLDFFLYYPHLIKDLNSGEFLSFDENGCNNSKGQVVVKFSKQFLNQIESMKQKNYVPKTARIRFIVYWQKENTEREVRIVLPELYFGKI